ncbi:MAG TPA: CHRD domain-containing protein [Rhodocyclaceae bacterium]|nr:CHRD domain-containing protein [Rhodocyclaceae bacterium]
MLKGRGNALPPSPNQEIPTMHTQARSGRLMKIAIATASALLFSLYAGASFGIEIAVKLSGSEEVPPVTTQASGGGKITINADKSVSGKVTTSGVAGTMAHIHMAAAGKNGPVIIHLQKEGENDWVVPAGAMLTDEQVQACKAGELYVNVHSAQNKGGEIRGQLKP